MNPESISQISAHTHDGRLTRVIELRLLQPAHLWIVRSLYLQSFFRFLLQPRLRVRWNIKFNVSELSFFFFSFSTGPHRYSEGWSFKMSWPFPKILWRCWSSGQIYDIFVCDKFFPLSLSLLLSSNTHGCYTVLLKLGAMTMQKTNKKKLL